jgi:hypothetical protein
MFSDLQVQNFVILYTDYALLAGYLLGCRAARYRQMQPICFLLLLTFVNDQVQSFIGFHYRLGVEDFHFYNPLQLILLGWFFYENFEEGILKRSVPYAVLAAILFSLINSLYIQTLHQNPTNFILVETFLLIIWSTMLFIEKLDSPPSLNVFRDPAFITAVAVLCFNLFSFIFFLLTNYFQKHKINQFTSIYKILYFAVIVYYGLLVIANIFSPKSIKSFDKN